MRPEIDAKAVMKFLPLPLLALLALPAFGAVSSEASAAAEAKINRILDDELSPGETVTLTQDEMNSYLRYGYAQDLPPGVRDLAVRFEEETGVVTGFADFSKMAAEGDSPGAFLLMMLRGERAIEARVRYTSARGMAQVEIESFKVDGREMQGPLLDWVVNTFVAPRMESFELGSPTPLDHNLEEVRLEPGRAVVVASATFADR
ncbi:MAG: hypothetical protein GC160_16330 [Acidobacteria bacterium]|nr:hypothetical protein [Acidobacteriota bacterium]